MGRDKGGAGGVVINLASIAGNQPSTFILSLFNAYIMWCEVLYWLDPEDTNHAQLENITQIKTFTKHTKKTKKS